MKHYAQTPESTFATPCALMDAPLFPPIASSPRGPSPRIDFADFSQSDVSIMSHVSNASRPESSAAAAGQGGTVGVGSVGVGSVRTGTGGAASAGAVSVQSLPHSPRAIFLPATASETSAAGDTGSVGSSTGASAVSSLRSLKKARRGAIYSLISDEDKYLAMLGYKNDGIVLNPVTFREDFCGACGVQHQNPNVLDLYPYCRNCQNCLRDHKHLRDRYTGVAQLEPLEILIATYGDTESPIGAIEITDVLNEVIMNFFGHDRLPFRDTQKFQEVFGGDPSPGKPKQMRIRYRMHGKHGYVALDVLPSNRIPSSVMLMCPSSRHLTILYAMFGHPKGRSSTGRMAYNVTENIQGLVDLNGGSYIHISPNTPLTRIFGDPCLGYTKDLCVEFDIGGRASVVTVAEMRGRLKTPLFIETSPVLSPLIFIESATYGISAQGKTEWMKHLNSLINRISYIEHRKAMKMQVKPSEARLIHKKQDLIAEREALKDCEPKCIDVTKKVQRIGEQQGGLVLKLDRKTFDPNFVFGNPLPGVKKLLEVAILCHGHDSESLTDSNEVTESGYPRNFIMGKQMKFMIPVQDDMSGHGIMQESLTFNTNNVLPLMRINRAMYGNPRDLKQLIDVTVECQNLVSGRFLKISTKQDLFKLFGDPCAGVPKYLRVEYVALGFKGSMRVRERDDLLVAALELGYPPAAEADV
jgi:hypothetical protein